MFIYSLYFDFSFNYRKISKNKCLKCYEKEKHTN